MWGAIIMPLCVFPWALLLPGNDVSIYTTLGKNITSSTPGCFENVIDSFIMIYHSKMVLIMTLGFFITVAFYNIFGKNSSPNVFLFKKWFTYLHLVYLLTFGLLTYLCLIY